MRRVAWVTHREWDSRVGGAEAADSDMVANKPEDVEVTVMWPGGISDDIADYDEVIVSGLYGFTRKELNLVAAQKPVMWMHDVQFSGHWLYGEAKLIVCISPQHREYELDKCPVLKPERAVINPGWMDTSVFDPQDEREPIALWAHRPVPHKGLDLAAEWAQTENRRLEVMVARPRLEVITRMGEVESFVLLSHIFDTGPRSVIEAQLSGCSLILNDNVGWFNIDPDELRLLLDDGANAFWGTILD